MISLKITSDWDLDIDNNGDFCFVNDEEELLQAACHAVYTFKGEDPFNQNNGIPYFEDIISSKTSEKSLIESYMRHEIKDIEGITNIYLMNNNFSEISRNYKATITITTIR